jgi:hypothetical protein
MTTEDSMRNAEIESILKFDRLRSKNRWWRVVLLGDPDCCQVLLKELIIQHGDEPASIRLDRYKSVIRDNVRDIMVAIEDIVVEDTSKMDAKTRELALLLVQELQYDLPDDAVISTTAAKILQEIWANEKFLEHLQSTDVGLPFSVGKSTSYGILE